MGRTQVGRPPLEEPTRLEQLDAQEQDIVKGQHELGGLAPKSQVSGAMAIAKSPTPALSQKVEQLKQIIPLKEELANRGEPAQKPPIDDLAKKQPAPAPIPQPEVLTRENAFSTFSL